MRHSKVVFGMILFLVMCVSCQESIRITPQASPSESEGVPYESESPGQPDNEQLHRELSPWEMEPPSNGERYTDDEISAYYKRNGRSVVELYDVGDNTVVAYKYKDSMDALEFVWFDRAIGERTSLTRGYIEVTEVQINETSVWLRSDNVNGTFIGSGAANFPKVYSAAIHDDGESRYILYDEHSYFMPVERDFDSGPGYQSVVLTGITFGLNGIRFEFGQHPENPWIGDLPSSPGISADLRNMTYVVRLYNTVLLDEYLLNTDNLGEMAILSVVQDGSDVVVQFEREKELQRYSIFSGNDRITSYPFTEIQFVDANTIGPFDFYPEGW